MHYTGGENHCHHVKLDSPSEYDSCLHVKVDIINEVQ